MAIKLNTADTHIVLMCLREQRELIELGDIEQPQHVIDALDNLILRYERSFVALCRLDDI